MDVTANSVAFGLGILVRPKRSFEDMTLGFGNLCVFLVTWLLSIC